MKVAAVVVVEERQRTLAIAKTILDLSSSSLAPPSFDANKHNN